MELLEPAIFLDRDGVVTVEKGYITEPGQLELIEGSASAIQKFNDLGIKVFIITNQSAIARGLVTVNTYHKIERTLSKMLLEYGASITKTYFSPYHKDGIVSEYAVNHITRKPNSGMFLKAKEEYDIDLNRSYMVGDNITDYESAVNVKLKGFILTKTGLGLKFLDKINSMKKTISFDVLNKLVDIDHTKYFS